MMQTWKGETFLEVVLSVVGHRGWYGRRFLLQRGALLLVEDCIFGIFLFFFFLVF